MNKTIISLGGSLIVPDEIDTVFLKKFRELVLSHVKKGKSFFIICGGGKITREYQEASSEITKLTREDLDWLGIHSTRLNAHLLRTIFRKESHPNIVKNPTKKINLKKKILIAAGWKPGCSTDYDAVLLAKNFRIKTIVNLTDIDYVYDKDPKKHKNAKPIKQISWRKFRKIVGDRWDPGMNVPFDPVASKEAEKAGLKVIILNGNNSKNLDDFLNGNRFKGTIIK